MNGRTGLIGCTWNVLFLSYATGGRMCGHQYRFGDGPKLKRACHHCSRMHSEFHSETGEVCCATAILRNITRRGTEQFHVMVNAIFLCPQSFDQQ